ncbi:MAG: hypothetical protein ACO1N2_00680 [Candidatus Saccharimonadota bacterium]
MTSSAKYIGVEDLQRTLEGIDRETCSHIYVIADQTIRAYVLRRDSPMYIAWELLREYGFELVQSQGSGTVGYAHFCRLTSSPADTSSIGLKRDSNSPIIVLITLDANTP